MKRTTVLTLLIIFAFLLFAGVAHAGVIDFVKDKISGGIIAGISFVFFGIAGLFLKGIYDVNRAKKAFEEIVDVVNKVQEAKTAKSPGGKEITKAEWGEIGKEAFEAIQAILSALPVKWQKKIGLIK